MMDGWIVCVREREGNERKRTGRELSWLLLRVDVNVNVYVYVDVGCGMVYKAYRI